VLARGEYPYFYFAASSPKLSDIAMKMGASIARVIDSAPSSVARLAPDSTPSHPASTATALPPHVQPSDSSQTSGDAQRVKLPHPAVEHAAPNVVVNGHECTPGDRSPVCRSVCGGPFGPCRDAAQRLKQEQEQFVLARRLLLQHGMPFDPYILLDAGGLAKLKPVLDGMSEMHQNRRESSLDGLIMADTLYLTEGATIGRRPVVVIVNHIVYEGPCPSLKGTSGGNVWGTDGFYLFERGAPRILGMSLERALQTGGFAKEQSGNNLPPFSVIRDLDLPKPDCTVGVDMSAPSPRRY